MAEARSAQRRLGHSGGGLLDMGREKKGRSVTWVVEGGREKESRSAMESSFA